VSGFGSRSNAVSEHFDLYTGNANPELARKIATYLGRDVSTVQRWERVEGMPVHRHVHLKRGVVEIAAISVLESRR